MMDFEFPKSLYSQQNFLNQSTSIYQSITSVSLKRMDESLTRREVQPLKTNHNKNPTLG